MKSMAVFQIVVKVCSLSLSFSLVLERSQKVLDVKLFTSVFYSLGFLNLITKSLAAFKPVVYTT